MTNKLNKFTTQLELLVKKRYTGTLKIRSSNLQKWIIYIRLGRLVWIDGGYHPNRSWQRHLAKYCPQVGMRQIKLSSLEKGQYCNYQYLASLFEQKLISKEQIQGIINSIILENIFEIFQQEEKRNLDYALESASHSPVLSLVLKIAFTLVDVETTLKQTRSKWEIWKAKGIVNWNPNLAPRIKNKLKLRQEVSDVVYQNFITFIDGNNTLQDLAFQMNSETYKVACSLIKYIRQDLLELVKVSDLERVENIHKSPINPVKVTNNIASNQKLVVTIDDSKVICHIMKEIVEGAGCKFIGIHHPLQAIPTLIGVKPDLIFLDLAMPIVNGYEICSQLRRVSLFKKIPIIILTANDGLIEKAKSKAIGATDFLAKPIAQEIILNILDKYLLLNRQQTKIERRDKIQFVTPQSNYAGV